MARIIQSLKNLVLGAPAAKEYQKPAADADPTIGTQSEEALSGLPTPVSTASFWHSEPNENLLDHRTTKDLPAEADIVIIGSGITGTSVARYLNEDERVEGKTIVMLEARQACWGATGRNGGHCQPLLFDHSSDISAFELKNVAAVKSYIEHHEIPCEWRTVPGCRTFWNEELLKTAEESINALKIERPDIAQHLTVIRDTEELKSYKIGDGCVGATLTQGAGTLWPYKYVTFILEKLVRDKFLNLQTNTPVTSISQVHSTPTSISSHRQIVTTSRGTIKTRTLILATNGYSSHLLPSFASLIVPTRGSMSALVPPQYSTRLVNSYGFVGSNGQQPQHDDYLIQRPFSAVPNPAGHLMFGGGRGEGSLPSVHEWDDSVLDEGAAAYLRRTLLTSLTLDGETEGLKELQPTNQWTGIMGYSRDDAPWVGKVPGKEHDGVFLCGGYTGHGMPNAGLCGRAVAQIAVADMEGKELREVEEKLVQEGDLPRGYIISQERIERAKGLPTVEVADAKGLLGHKLPGSLNLNRI